MEQDGKPTEQPPKAAMTRSGAPIRQLSEEERTAAATKAREAAAERAEAIVANLANGTPAEKRQRIQEGIQEALLQWHVGGFEATQQQ